MNHAYTSVYYFENDVAPLEPETMSLLFTVKLRENGRTTRLMTQCCYSYVAIDHPYYDENVVCVHTDACDLVAPQIQTLCRIFTRDWDAACDGKMPEAIASLEESDATWKEFAGLIKRPVHERKGIKLQQVLAQLPPPTILGLKEAIRLLPPIGTKAEG